MKEFICTMILCLPLQDFFTKINHLPFITDTSRLLELNYIVTNGLTQVMSQVFLLNDNIRYALQDKFKTGNVNSLQYHTDTLAELGPKN